MAAGPTRNQGLEGSKTWKASTPLATGIRLFAFVVPLVGSWLLIRLVGPTLYMPDGRWGLALWMVQAAVIGSAAVMLIDRFTRRLLPLAALYGMSLVFPDEAPSRFSMALRMGSSRRMTDLVVSGASSSAQESAERAIELVSILGAHDRRTRGHSERVRAYVDLIAEELKIGEVERSRLSWAALLHDIGKLQVSPSILNKQAKPSAEEWEELSGHPMHSIAYLGPLEGWLGEWVGAAAHHHERWDGNGYPFGLEGHQISLAGRITAVADAYDSMTAKRSYNVPLQPEVARKELVNSAGSQFDPAIVRAFLGVSLGRRWWAGPFTWLTQVPSLSGASSGLTAVASIAISSVAVLGAVNAGVAPVAAKAPAFEVASVGRVIDDSDPVLVELDEPTGTTIDTTTLPGVSTTTLPPTTTTLPPTTTTSPGIPAAGGDLFTASANKNEKIYILLNDDPGDSPLLLTSLRIVSPPTHAKSFSIQNDHINYKAEAAYAGPDSLVYEICNENGLCDTATVAITVIP